MFVCQVLEEMKSESKPIKIDRRLTGSSIIDEPLQQVPSTKPNRQMKAHIHAFEEPVVSPLMSFSQAVELSLHKSRLFPPMTCVRHWISSFESLGWAAVFHKADEHMTLVFSQWSHMLYWISFTSAYNAYILLGSLFLMLHICIYCWWERFLAP